MAHEQLGSFDYAYYNLNKTHQIAASLGVKPLTTKLKGNLQIVQWSMNPWIDSQQKNAKESEQNLPDPLIQLGGYSATTDLDTTQSTNLGDGSNHGIYGAITWPVSLPIGNDNRIWISSSLSLNPNNNPLISYVAGGLLSEGILPWQALGCAGPRREQKRIQPKHYFQPKL
jgi:porin